MTCHFALGMPVTTLAYVPSENVFVLVGDVKAFEDMYEPISELVRHVQGQTFQATDS